MDGSGRVSFCSVCSSGGQTGEPRPTQSPPSLQGTSSQGRTSWARGGCRGSERAWAGGERAHTTLLFARRSFSRPRPSRPRPLLGSPGRQEEARNAGRRPSRLSMGYEQGEVRGGRHLWVGSGKENGHERACEHNLPRPKNSWPQPPHCPKKVGARQYHKHFTSASCPALGPPRSSAPRPRRRTRHRWAGRPRPTQRRRPGRARRP